MWPTLTENELMDGVQMALSVIMNQSKLVGRKLHPQEIRWVVRAGFAYRYQNKLPLSEAHRRADMVMNSMVEAQPQAAEKLLEKIEKAKDEEMVVDSENEYWLKEGIDFAEPMEIKEIERRAKAGEEDGGFT